ncbi:hypothetical protein Agub_g11717 [Astrephomene gubernaculifera]|uniref:Magnesium transporter n=1 Tax=Astrephomene gubernaculifera TaxID=47775 RepID=A0AAD3HR45_9CHLO|nr:hypothetical protein Agub_g11717 [Astrephomene gubernaculifera]
MASSSPPPLPESSPPPPGESSAQLWYVGAIINVVGSISINLGMNMMKLGHTKRDELDVPEEEKPPIRKFRSWLFGIIIFATGNVLNFVSFAFAAQSLLSALGSLQLVCNVVFAYFVNHEPITKLIILSTLCIIGGCVLLVVFGNQSSETYTVAMLMHFYTQPAYVIYLVMMGVFVFGFYIVYLHCKKVSRKHGAAAGWTVMLMVSYAIFSALLGSQSVLFGKSISVVVRSIISGPGSVRITQLKSWYTYVAPLIFIFVALFWVTRLNKGLRMFPAMLVVPLMQIAWTLFSIVSGMLYFQEYTGFTTLKAIMFPVGVLVVFFGVFLLTVGHRGGAAEELEGELEEKPCGGLAVHDNAAFSNVSEAGDSVPSEMHPQHPKMSLGQTLRLTSTWAPASVAVSPGSAMGRTLMTGESIRRSRRVVEGPADLNASALTHRSYRTDEGEHAATASTPDRNSTLNKTTHSNASRASETPSMMGTMRKGLRSLRLLASDLMDPRTGLKLTVGLGDSGLAAVGLGVMPVLPTNAKQRPSRSGGALELASSLPRSKFHTYRADADTLAPIREASGLPPTKPPSMELAASLTASSQLHPSSHGGARTPGPGGSPPLGGRQPTSSRHASPFRPARRPSGGDEFAALRDMLPAPSYRPSQDHVDIGHQDARPQAPPQSSGAPGKGPSFRRAPQSGIPEGRLPLPGFGPGPGPGSSPSPGGETTTSRAYESDSPSSPRRYAAGYGGPPDAAAAVVWPPAPSGRQPGKPGSFATLPEGVPLSTANSIVMHESRPSTPPEVMLGGGGPGEVQGGPRMAPSWLQQAASSPYRQPYGQYQQQPQYQSQQQSQYQYQQQQSQYQQQQLSQYQQQQYQYQQPQYQYVAPAPLGGLRSSVPHMTGARLPRPHLLIPGMPVMSPPAAQPAVAGTLLPYLQQSVSYAQLLSGQLVADGGGLMGPMQPHASVGSHGGFMPAGAPPAAVLLQSRQHSPRGLSVSRSWAGVGGATGGLGASHQSPLRGSYLGPQARALRPWQY